MGASPTMGFHEVFWGELRAELARYGECEVRQSGAIIRFASGVETRREFLGEYDLPAAYCAVLRRTLAVDRQPRLNDLLSRLALLKAAIKTHSRQDLLLRLKYDCAPGRLVTYDSLKNLLIRAKLSPALGPLPAPHLTDPAALASAFFAADLADIQRAIEELGQLCGHGHVAGGRGSSVEDDCDWAATLQRVASLVERFGNLRINQARTAHLEKRKQLYFNRYTDKKAGPFDQYRTRVRPRLTRLAASFEDMLASLTTDMPAIKAITDIEPRYQADMLAVVESAHRAEQKLEELSERLVSSNKVIENLTSVLAGYQPSV